MAQYFHSGTGHGTGTGARPDPESDSDGDDGHPHTYDASDLKHTPGGAVANGMMGIKMYCFFVALGLSQDQFNILVGLLSWRRPLLEGIQSRFRHCYFILLVTVLNFDEVVKELKRVRKAILGDTPPPGLRGRGFGHGYEACLDWLFSPYGCQTAGCTRLHLHDFWNGREVVANACIRARERQLELGLQLHAENPTNQAWVPGEDFNRWRDKYALPALYRLYSVVGHDTRQILVSVNGLTPNPAANMLHEAWRVWLHRYNFAVIAGTDLEEDFRDTTLGQKYIAAMIEFVFSQFDSVSSFDLAQMTQMAKNMDSILQVMEVQGGVYPALLGTIGFQLGDNDYVCLKAQYDAAVAASAASAEDTAAYRELNAVVSEDTPTGAAPVGVAPVGVAPVSAPTARLPTKSSSSQRPTRSARPLSAEGVAEGFAELHALLDAEISKFNN